MNLRCNDPTKHFTQSMEYIPKDKTYTQCYHDGNNYIVLALLILNVPHQRVHSRDPVYNTKDAVLTIRKTSALIEQGLVRTGCLTIHEWVSKSKPNVLIRHVKSTSHSTPLLDQILHLIIV